MHKEKVYDRQKHFYKKDLHFISCYDKLSGLCTEHRKTDGPLPQRLRGKNVYDKGRIHHGSHSDAHRELHEARAA